MADLLSKNAAQDYFHVSLISHDHGVIGKMLFLERLSVLSWIGDPSDGAVVFANEILKDHEWSFNSADGEYGTGVRGNNDKNSPKKSRERSDGGDSIAHFGMNVGGDNWEFHPFDNDFFPSIPHGHKREQNLIKLDPYLGYVYNKSNQCGRLSRKDIIALWSDDKFRNMASMAIDYYLCHHPHYMGWRIDNPRRLPRIRR